MISDELKRKLFFRIALFPALLAVLILLPAGSWWVWPVYVYFALLLGSMSILLAIFWKRDPAFLERRMKTGETEPVQKKIIVVSLIVFVSGFLVVGFDHRFGLSRVPAYIVFLADTLVLLGYFFILRVFLENPHASRIIETHRDHRVISTGPYAIVRHPMYVGALVLFLATPVALGSFWALLPFAFLILTLALRIQNEETFLLKHLKGYEDYCRKVRFRLIPFVW